MEEILYSIPLKKKWGWGRNLCENILLQLNLITASGMVLKSGCFVCLLFWVLLFFKLLNNKQPESNTV